MSFKPLKARASFRALCLRFNRRATASLCRVNRKTAAHFFLRLRKAIAKELGAEGEAMFVGEIELDESYFGEVFYAINQ